MKKEVILYPDGTAPWPRAVKAGNWIFMAVAGTDPDGNVVGPSFEEQLTYCYESMKKTLESLGSSMDNIVQMTMYYVDMERDIDKVSKIWGKYFTVGKYPSVAGIGIKELMPTAPQPPLLIEMTLTAIIPDE